MPEKTKDEQRAELERQLAELDKPDEPTGGTRSHNVNVTIDLGDPEQVKRGLKLGLIDRGDLDEFDEPASDDDPPANDDDPPRRRQRYG